MRAEAAQNPGNRRDAGAVKTLPDHEELVIEARQMAEDLAAAVQLALRIRHPSLDPKEITAGIGIEPDHSFKAGDPARGRRGKHVQTYWLARITAESWPEVIDANFLSTIAARNAGQNLEVTAEKLRQATMSLWARSVETMLLYALHRLNARHEFLDKMARDGGEVAFLLSVESNATIDCTVPVAVMRLLVKWGISLELKFDSANAR